MPDFLTKTFNKTEITKLRADFLKLMQAAEKESTPEEAKQVGMAVSKYSKYLEELFYKQIAPAIPYLRKNLEKHTAKSYEDSFRKDSWLLVIELSMPFYWTQLEHHTLQQRYRDWQLKKRNWILRAKRAARKTWTALDTLFEISETSSTLSIRDRSKTRQDVAGISLEIIGDAKKEEITKIVSAIHLAKESLKQFKDVKTLPIIYNSDNDDLSGSAGTYEYTHIELNRWAIQDDIKGIARVILHEWGHHAYKQLTEAARNYWDTAVRSDLKNLKLSEVVKKWPKDLEYKSLYRVHDYFMKSDPVFFLQLQALIHKDLIGFFKNKADAESALAQEDKEYVVPSNPITGYATKNTEEAFCESFAMYGAYGPRAVLPLVRLWLKTVLPSSEVVTASYKEKVSAFFRSL